MVRVLEAGTVGLAGARLLCLFWPMFCLAACRRVLPGRQAEIGGVPAAQLGKAHKTTFTL